MQPLISVVIPSFNSAFLQECVDSVLCQTFENFEVIVVDCSTDELSRKVIERFNHPKVKVFSRTGQHLPGSNRNFGIERAFGGFIVCLDADDMLEPTFLEEALFVITCLDYTMVGTSIRTFGVMNRTMKLHSHPTLELIANGDCFSVTFLCRKEFYLQLGGFIDHALGAEHIPEDWDFCVRALLSGATLYNLGSYGLRYRKHWDSITAQPDLPSREQMKERIRARYVSQLSQHEPSNQPTSAKLQEDGWRQMLGENQKRDAGLIILPEDINEVYVERLKAAIQSCTAPLMVISTCQMETYPEKFLQLLFDIKASLFSLPDILEDQDHWLEFIRYLGASRKVVAVWYGQNHFALDKAPAFSEIFPHATLNYLPRYSAAPGFIPRRD